MGRVEVRADGLACGSAKSQHRRSVVDHEARVRLDRHANAVLAGERGRLGPVGEHARVPLPGERLGEVRRPRVRHPTRAKRALGLARAAGERHHGRDTELGGEPNGVAKCAVGGPGYVCLRVQRVAVAGERRDREPALPDGGREPRPLPGVGEQSGGAAVRARLTGLDLDGGAPGDDRRVECRLQRAVVKEREEQADRHEPSTSAMSTGRRSSVERAMASVVARLRRLSATVVSGTPPDSMATRRSARTPARSTALSRGSGTR